MSKDQAVRITGEFAGTESSAEVMLRHRSARVRAAQS